MTTERMPSPTVLIPEAAAALAAIGKAVDAVGLDDRLLALIRRHARAAPLAEKDPLTEEDRAVLALASCVISPGSDPVPDQVWDLAAKHFDQRELAALLLTITITNALDHISSAIRSKS
ncbi:carboxymuconolactone decarboxylase family protein [Actinoplanes sp. NPDC000266]